MNLWEDVNPWWVAGNIVGWFLVLVLVYALAVNIIKWLRTLVPSLRAKDQAKSLDNYLKQATAVSDRLYVNDAVYSSTDMALAFMAGARWGWVFVKRN